MTSKALLAAAAGLLLFVGGGCGNGFVRTDTPGWDTIPLRTGCSLDNAWDRTLRILEGEFAVARADRAAYANAGLIETAWLASHEGQPADDFKVRARVQLRTDKRALLVCMDAQSFDGQAWLAGQDLRAQANLEQKLRTAVGAPRSCEYG